MLQILIAVLLIGIFTIGFTFTFYYFWQLEKYYLKRKLVTQLLDPQSKIDEQNKEDSLENQFNIISNDSILDKDLKSKKDDLLKKQSFSNKEIIELKKQSPSIKELIEIKNNPNQIKNESLIELEIINQNELKKKLDSKSEISIQKKLKQIRPSINAYNEPPILSDKIFSKSGIPKSSINLANKSTADSGKN